MGKAYSIEKPEGVFFNIRQIHMGLGTYLRDTQGELKHVSWPTRKQVVSFTGLVITISILVAAFLGFFDTFFTYLLETFII